MADCKYCDAPIIFEKNAWGRWATYDPGTMKRHVCELEQRCGNCNKPFNGAPYMTLCPPCYKADGDHTRGFQKPKEEGNFGDPGVRSTTRYDTKVYPAKKSEALKSVDDDDYFDDIPF